MITSYWGHGLLFKFSRFWESMLSGIIINSQTFLRRKKQKIWNRDLSIMQNHSENTPRGVNRCILHMSLEEWLSKKKHKLLCITSLILHETSDSQKKSYGRTHMTLHVMPIRDVPYRPLYTVLSLRLRNVQQINTSVFGLSIEECLSTKVTSTAQ